MGYIKEPERVDLVINGGPLSEEVAGKISVLIQRYKMHKTRETVREKPFVRLRRTKELALNTKSL